MLISRRECVSILSASSFLVLPLRHAGATTLRAFSLSELVERSERVAVGLAVHHDCGWAYVGGSRRIVTWTRFVEQEDVLSGEESSSEILLVTLGGKVGSLRQKVPGEATLTLGVRTLLFSGAESYDGARPVVGMSQGEYSIEIDDQVEVVRPSRSLPQLVKAKAKDGRAPIASAVEVLSGKSLEQARTLVRGAR